MYVTATAINWDELPTLMGATDSHVKLATIARQHILMGIEFRLSKRGAEFAAEWLPIINIVAAITDGKWWIDRQDLVGNDLFAELKAEASNV